MTNQEKLEALKAVLKQTNTEYWENVAVGDSGVVIPLFLPKQRIAVRIGDDDIWYHKLRRFVHPVIIRDLDTAQFVIEKVNNTIEQKCTYRRDKSPRHYLTPEQQKRKRSIFKFRKRLHAEHKFCVPQSASSSKNIKSE